MVICGVVLSRESRVAKAVVFSADVQRRAGSTNLEQLGLTRKDGPGKGLAADPLGYIENKPWSCRKVSSCLL